MSFVASIVEIFKCPLHCHTDICLDGHWTDKKTDIKTDLLPKHLPNIVEKVSRDFSLSSPSQSMSQKLLAFHYNNNSNSNNNNNTFFSPFNNNFLSLACLLYDYYYDQQHFVHRTQIILELSLSLTCNLLCLFEWFFYTFLMDTVCIRDLAQTLLGRVVWF